jgi:5-formyltetrahydrofolate cyclo-ligase
MKKGLRTQLLKKRNTLPAELARQASKTIQAELLALPVFQEAARLMIYVSMGSEIYTDGIIQHSLQMGKQVAVPYLHQQYGQMDASEIRDLEQEMMIGKFYSRVPKPEYFRPLDPKDIDIIIIPGIAFDLQGNRLGYGGGYYDRYLKLVRPETILIGITYSVLVVEELPAYPHDMPVDIVLHEQGIIHTTKKVMVHQ